MLHRTLIVGPSGSGKTNYLLNSIQRDPNNIDNIYFYTKDLEKPKYNLLINKREKTGINFNNDPSVFIEYSNFMDDILSNIEDYKKKRKRKVSITFDDMISHVMSGRRAQHILKDLFIRCKKLNTSIWFLTQSYFSVPKDVILNYTHYILFKLKNKIELQNKAINHSADTDYKEFMESVLVSLSIFLNIDTTKYKAFTKNFDGTLENIKDQLKFFNNNQADYDLYRKNVKISAFSSGKLDKYEYLTCEDLGYRQDLAQKAKFENSSFCQVFTKGLDSNEKQEGLLKKIKKYW